MPLKKKGTENFRAEILLFEGIGYLSSYRPCREVIDTIEDSNLRKNVEEDPKFCADVSSIAIFSDIDEW